MQFDRRSSFLLPSFIQNPLISTKKAFVRYWLPVLLLLGIIAVESTDMMSGEHTGRLLGFLLHRFHHFSEFVELSVLNHWLRKTGHFVGYGMLSFLIFRAFRGTYRASHEGYYGWLSSRVENVPTVEVFSTLWRAQWAMMGWMGATLVAVLDELHQMTLPSRTGLWSDVVLDSCGALTAQVLTIFAAKAIASRRQSKAEARFTPRPPQKQNAAR